MSIAARNDKQSFGVTLVEVLFVLGILLLLSSLVFVLNAPSREKARQSACSQQLRQLYMAAQMYAIDCDVDATYPELHGLAYIPDDFKPVFAPYGVSSDLFFCPTFPHAKRQKYYTSYGFTFVGDPMEVPTLGVPTKRQLVVAAESKFGSNMNMIICTVHDEFYVAPRENDRTLPPFIVSIRASGNIFVGRDGSRQRGAFFSD